MNGWTSPIATHKYKQLRKEEAGFSPFIPLQFYVEKPATTLEQLCFKLKHLVSTQGQIRAVRFRPDTTPLPPCICSCSFTPRYLHSTFEFGIDLNHTVYFIYADWKCELREGVLNVIKLWFISWESELL